MTTTSVSTTRSNTGRWIAGTSGALLLLLAACIAGWIFLIRPMLNANTQPAANRADAAMLAASNGETAEISPLRQNKQFVMIFVGNENEPIETYEINPSLGAVRAQIVNGTVILFNQAGEAIHTITRASAEITGPANLPQIDNSGTTTETLGLAAPQPTVAPTAAPVDNTVRFADGTVVSAESLTKRIGGDIRGWTARCDAPTPANECGIWGYWHLTADGTDLGSFMPALGEDLKITFWTPFLIDGREFNAQQHAITNGAWVEFTPAGNPNDDTVTIQRPGQIETLETILTGPIDGWAIIFPAR